MKLYSQTKPKLWKIKDFSQNWYLFKLTRNLLSEMISEIWKILVKWNRIFKTKTTAYNEQIPFKNILFSLYKRSKQIFTSYRIVSAVSSPTHEGYLIKTWLSKAKTLLHLKFVSFFIMIFQFYTLSLTLFYLLYVF